MEDLSGNSVEAAGVSAERLQEWQERGLEKLHEHGLLAMAGVVIVCPDARGNGAVGTLADALGMGNADVDRNFDFIVSRAEKTGDDLGEALLAGFGMVVVRDDNGEAKREDLSTEVADFTQKKTLNPTATS